MNADDDSPSNLSIYNQKLTLENLKKKNRVLKGLDAPVEKNPLFQFKCKCSVCLKNTSRK